MPGFFLHLSFICSVLNQVLQGGASLQVTLKAIHSYTAKGKADSITTDWVIQKAFYVSHMILDVSSGKVSKIITKFKSKTFF